jgi:hypothetical protein
VNLQKYHLRDTAWTFSGIKGRHIGLRFDVVSERDMFTGISQI